MRLVAVVEGYGEVGAAPLLLRRAASILAPDVTIDVRHPIRLPKSRLLRSGEVERVTELAARQSGPTGAIFFMVDADDECPARLGPDLLERAKRARADRRIYVVIAKAEYESWFLAAARSLAGKRGLPSDLRPPAQPETIRDAKGWLSSQMVGRYRETLDQTAMTAEFDLEEARRAPSFERLWRDLADALRGGGTGEVR